jgi:hypothetical protein
VGAVGLQEQRKASAAAVTENAASRKMTAEAARDRVANAIRKGGKVRIVMEKDTAGNPVNAPYVEDQDEDGNTILRRINMVGPGEGGEEVQTLGTQRPSPGKVITGPTGEQKLVNPNTGEEIKSKASSGPLLASSSLLPALSALSPASPTLRKLRRLPEDGTRPESESS